MTKLGLLLGVTTMLTSISGAMAGSTSTQSIKLNSYCDVLNFTLSGANVGQIEYSSSCTADIMGGFKIKNKKIGAGSFIFVGGPRFSGGTDAWGWLVQLPFATGNAAYLYESTNGVSYTLIASSSYTLGTDGRSTKGLLPPAGKVKQDLSNSNVPKTLKF